MSRDDRLVLLGVLCLASAFVGIELMRGLGGAAVAGRGLADWTQLRRASWVVNGYLLAYIAVMPLAGRAADRFGLPRLLISRPGVVRGSVRCSRGRRGRWTPSWRHAWSRAWAAAPSCRSPRPAPASCSRGTRELGRWEP